MKILVYGAGVIGSLYGGKLQMSGHSVTMLARNERLAEIRKDGLTLENVSSGVCSVIRTEATDHLSPEDNYELVVIAVRRDQLARIAPELVANARIPTFLLCSTTRWVRHRFR
jgi:2-dehydropantoate 2-reductase